MKDVFFFKVWIRDEFAFKIDGADNLFLQQNVAFGTDYKCKNGSLGNNTWSYIYLLHFNYKKTRIDLICIKFAQDMISWMQTVQMSLISQ